MSAQAGSVEDDPSFQAGLENMLQILRQNGAGEEEILSMTDRAKEFYRSKQNSITAESTPNEPHQEELAEAPSSFSNEDNSGSSSTTAMAATTSNPPYPTSFSSLAALISSGIPLDALSVPGLKDIPDKINEEPPSQSVMARQEGAGKKPWET